MGSSYRGVLCFLPKEIRYLHGLVAETQFSIDLARFGHPSRADRDPGPIGKGERGGRRVMTKEKRRARGAERSQGGERATTKPRQARVPPGAISDFWIFLRRKIFENRRNFVNIDELWDEVFGGGGAAPEIFLTKKEPQEDSRSNGGNLRSWVGLVVEISWFENRKSMS